MNTNPFIKPIISKHNNSPLLGGRIINLKIKSLNGFANPFKNYQKLDSMNRYKTINPFKYESINDSNINSLVLEYIQPMGTPFAPIGHFQRPRVPFIEKASLGAKVIRMKNDRPALTPYHSNKKHSYKFAHWKSH